ncbi:Trm112 family protein [Nitratireductor luteus]|uniref:Trm112 family protein n=1 Tax=Nitratireductor luteus TaxID=2976980 RepID=UPI002240A337|nr:Trm112 family protein [Nitratireductor luteus]
MRRNQDDNVDVKMLELLICPISKAPLKWDRERSELVSRAAGLAYPVRDGIPVMLPSEARPLSDDIPGRPA